MTAPRSRITIELVAVTALVLGILSLLTSFFAYWLAIPFGLVAVVLAMRARTKARAAGQSTQLGTAGLALGAVGFTIGLTVHLVFTVATARVKNRLKDAPRDARMQSEFKDVMHKALEDEPAPASQPQQGRMPADGSAKGVF